MQWSVDTKTGWLWFRSKNFTRLVYHAPPYDGNVRLMFKEYKLNDAK